MYLFHLVVNIWIIIVPFIEAKTATEWFISNNCSQKVYMLFNSDTLWTMCMMRSVLEGGALCIHDMFVKEV